jgi:hypothetical protein
MRTGQAGPALGVKDRFALLAAIYVRMGPKSNMQLSGVLVKTSWITLPDVSTRLRPD